MSELLLSTGLSVVPPSPASSAEGSPGHQHTPLVLRHTDQLNPLLKSAELTLASSTEECLSAAQPVFVVLDVAV